MQKTLEMKSYKKGQKISKLYLLCWERFEKFYSNRKIQMIEGEEISHKLLHLLQIIEITIKGFKALSSSLNLEYKAPYKGDNN